MRQLSLCVAVLATLFLSAQEPTTFQSQFPLKWKVKIGGTTFKTNFLLHDGLLLVGSNGDHYRDWALDYNNGVYYINPANGQIIHHVAHDGFGDMDVNGVVALGNKIYFGNDNDEFLCFDTTGKQIWRVPVSGDVEAEPVMFDINGDGTKEIFFGTETGEVTALDSKNGNTLWSFKIDDFSGWNKTDNRFLFKVGAHFSNGAGFVAKPAVTDLNGDAVPDLIYNCRDNYTYALNGKNGNLLWKSTQGPLYYVGYAPLVVENGNQKNIYLLQYRTDEKNAGHQDLVRLNNTGALEKRYPGTWNFSVSYTPLLKNNRIISIERDTIAAVNLTTGILTKVQLPLKAVPVNNSNYGYYGRRVSAQPQFFDFLKTGSEQLLLLSEDGAAQILDGTNFKQLKNYLLPAGTETTPLIADIDGDGKMEMLVSCYDGYLYCFDLKISAKGLAGTK